MVRPSRSCRCGNGCAERLDRQKFNFQTFFLVAFTFYVKNLVINKLYVFLPSLAFTLLSLCARDSYMIRNRYGDRRVKAK